MRAAAILGLGSSEKDLQPFRQASSALWTLGMPAHSTDADAILIFGGDGTMHRHLAHLVRLNLPVIVVPCGSGNDFARALKLRAVADTLLAWREFSSGGKNVKAIDLGVISPLAAAGEAPAPHKHYFCCVGGAGLDAETARRANRLPRWLRGHGGYALSLPAALFRFAPHRMKISRAMPDQPEQLAAHLDQPVFMAAFANTPVYGGGMKIAPRAQMDDGQLDICVIREIGKFKLFRLFPTVYFGRHLDIPQVDYFQAARLRIETDVPLEVYADGEYVCRTPIDVSVARAALRVIVHPSNAGF
jgi:diacylglycerol kinase (ATP)